MEATSYFAPGFFSKVFQLFSIITHTLSLSSTSVPTSSQWNDPERLSLLAIKSQIEPDPMEALNSLNDSLHHCDWKGITCSLRHPGRVTMLDLYSQKLQGTLSPYISNLTFLSEIRLGENNFDGVIPQEIGGLHRLQNLVLSKNSFAGKFPIQLSNCSNLRGIYLDYNHFSGNILPVVSSFPKIAYLNLQKNYFSGHIPSSLGNPTSLRKFSIVENHMEGSIPGDICRFRRLGLFDVGSNNLTGKIPSSLYNQSHMYIFSVSENQLEGSLPSDIGFALPKTQGIFFDENKFSGPVPTSLSNATNLEDINFSANYFTGSVPTDLGRPQGLRRVSFYMNQLGTKTGDDLNFINSLPNCTKLTTLELGINFLNGLLPVSLSNFSAKFRFLDARENKLYGEIPGLGNLVKVEIIYSLRSKI